MPVGGASRSAPAALQLLCSPGPVQPAQCHGFKLPVSTKEHIGFPPGHSTPGQASAWHFAPCLLPLRVSLRVRSLHSTPHKDPVSYTPLYLHMAASRSRALRDAGQPLTLASAHGKGDLKGWLVGLPIW